MHIEPLLDLVVGLLPRNEQALAAAPTVILLQQDMKTLIAVQHLASHYFRVAAIIPPFITRVDTGQSFAVSVLHVLLQMLSLF